MQSSPDELILFLLISTILILMMGGFIISMLFVYRNRQLKYLKQLESIRMDYEKNLLTAQLEIQEQTFEAISREIHDNINLSLTLVKLNLNRLRKDSEISEGSIIESIKLIGKVINELTDLSRSMNSEVIKECGLISALYLEVERIKKLESHIVQFELVGHPIFLESQKELFIFRIIQEAFNNILKHAGAKNIFIQLNYESDKLTIKIRDDGVGFLKVQTHNRKNDSFPTVGLKNMERRAKLLNGNFSVKSRPGSGTTLQIILPL